MDTDVEPTQAQLLENWATRKQKNKKMATVARVKYALKSETKRAATEAAQDRQYAAVVHLMTTDPTWMQARVTEVINEKSVMIIQMCEFEKDVVGIGWLNRTFWARKRREAQE